MDTRPFVPRQTESGADILLGLLANPFESQIQTNSFLASLGFSFGISAFLIILFCLLRPRTDNVYAPRARYADEKHAPPPVGKGLLSWIKPIKTAKESELVDKVGLDATIFLRFLRMNRNIFLCMSVVGLGILLPVNLIGANQFSQHSAVGVYAKFTPQYIFGRNFWAYVIVAYLFNAIVCGFLWWNYRAILKLRRAYLNSPDYLNALHSRTLFLTHVPRASRTDDGLLHIIEKVKHIEDTSTTAIARNTRDLPHLIEEYEHAVRKLEECLARYLANPNMLPSTRPTCKPDKNDKGYKGGRKVDAIDYLTGRVQELGTEINEVRESVDKRNPLPYGFASYTHIEDAHSVAYAARRKGPEGTTITLAPKPNDLIWKNLDMSRSKRRARFLWTSFWMVVLTVLYIPPNALIAIFLSNLVNLGKVWPAFQTSLEANPRWWAAVQGISAPTLQTLFYLILPTIFRRLAQHSGDPTKTSRERHVMNKLYVFFVFNNLIVFSMFSAAWAFVTAVVKAQNLGVWEAIKQGNIVHSLFYSLCNISPYWITWQTQRLLGASIDLIQAWTLVVNGFRRHFLHPTPRELIELSAPQPFLYGEYYNNYLFIATAGIVYAGLQPLVLPITAFYFALETWLKKYLLQYVFITKTESGGAFWRNLFNRWLFAALLADVIVALIVAAQGYSWTMLYSLIPLPFLLLAFKYVCAKSFDVEMDYYTIKSLAETEGAAAVQSGSELKKAKRSAERVGVRFGNPVLYRKLIKPMVHTKAQHLLREVYKGRIDGDEEAVAGPSGGARAGMAYSDIYMSQMAPEKPGKPVHFAQEGTQSTPVPFELVSEHQLDFENFKRRAEFRDEFGGDGELYGRPDDVSSISRPGTPSSMTTMSTAMTGAERGRNQSPTGDSTRADSASRYQGETRHPRGYTGLRADEHDHSLDRGHERTNMLARFQSADITASGPPSIHEGGEEEEDDTGRLLTHAAQMGKLRAMQSGIEATPSERGYGGSNYFNLPTSGLASGFTSGRASPMLDDGEEYTSYDNYRRGGRL